MYKKLLRIMSITGILTAAILYINWAYLKEFTTLFSAINIFSLIVFTFPIILIKYNEHRKRKEVEEMFPVFLRDFVEEVRGGMTIPQAFKSLTGNEYQALTPFIKKISAQLEWGIPVERVLMNFAKESKSRVIRRITSSVIETHNYGGNLANTFEALSSTALEIERLREERKLYLNSQMITGYIIFFVFLAVIIGLEKFLVPSLTSVSNIGIAGITQNPEELGIAYKEIFRNLILMQGLFAGLAVGKMAEGATIAGLKHSIFMMFTGTVVFLLAG